MFVQKKSISLNSWRDSFSQVLQQHLHTFILISRLIFTLLMTKNIARQQKSKINNVRPRCETIALYDIQFHPIFSGHKIVSGKSSRDCIFIDKTPSKNFSEFSSNRLSYVHNLGDIRSIAIQVQCFASCAEKIHTIWSKSRMNTRTVFCSIFGSRWCAH
jgi:hypothetical protein